MADEITFAFRSGATLTYGVYEPDGSVRTAAGTSLPEEGSTGYYHADNADIVAADLVIIKEDTVVVGGGEYLPAVTPTADSLQDVTDDIADLQADVDQLGIDLNKVHDINVEPLPEPESFQVQIG